VRWQISTNVNKERPHVVPTRSVATRRVRTSVAIFLRVALDTSSTLTDHDVKVPVIGCCVRLIAPFFDDFMQKMMPVQNINLRYSNKDSDA
jgi:hypothetical protein